MEEDGDDEPTQITPTRQKKAAEARQALERGIELVQSAISRIKDEPLPAGEEEDVEIAYEYENSGEHDYTFTGREIELGEESEDDENTQESNMSARVREKQPAEPDTEASPTTRSEKRHVPGLATRLRRQQETEIEKAERIRLLEEGYVSLANVAYLTKNKEEEDKYLRLAEIVKGAGIDEDEDEDMEQDD
ncbi:hypothetical protein AGABI1DRAFT_98227 [Agaricus bisporus var. burnettii JB137-S8]|uniref:Uncharacterized protein n=1 Tax=Agaricus bisporus var. burnettii (strain JB137-S8 / ATCC MYA-4627 / FGSC 10392) TaxID=597362 RepID=K5W494_AGABU|nr:uncharacterized protein AGABI1DRAFT_98227 [Agaricus bisporus var. burnettii JB137-S8]EKM81584.1 hypothetical protein AGABI1DRAFT_98227 [Agaricus bisporus var. burnettii JB137-S8]